MILHNANNLSVLPFYTDIEEQNHRKSYAYGNVYPLYVSNQSLIPFQFTVTGNAAASVLGNVTVRNLNGDIVKEIGPGVMAFDIVVLERNTVTRETTCAIVFYPNTIDLDLDSGQFYLQMQLVAGAEFLTIYSEVFTVINNTALNNMLTLEWWDETSLVYPEGTVWYNGERFKNTLHICTEIGKPEYQFEEEGETRDGYFFPEKRLSEKTYRFTFLAPEYLCDALRIVRLSDHVVIRDNFGRVYNIESFLPTIEWQTDGALASVEVEFQTPTVIKKIGKAFSNTD